MNRDKALEYAKDDTVCSIHGDVIKTCQELIKMSEKYPNCDLDIVEDVRFIKSLILIARRKAQHMENRLKKYHTKITELGFTRNKRRK